jgi:CDP-diglyceride synthetase
VERAAGIVLAVVAVLAALIGRIPLLIVASVVAVVAAGEAFRLARARGIKPAALVGLAGIVTLLVVAHVRGERSTAVLPWVLALVVGASFVAMMLRRGRSDTTRAIAYTVLTVLLIGLFGAYVIAVRAVGFRLFLGFVLMVLGAQAARGLGRHRTGSIPRAVGAALLGALVMAVIVALAMHDPFTWPRALVLALIVSVVVPLGARAIDMIDREVVLEPGVRRPRAGLLRQVDGLLVSAPVFYYAFRVLAR